MALTAEQLQQMDSDSGLTSSKIAQMDIDAGISQPQHDDSWLRQIVTPAQLQQWKSKGHIGAIEAFNRFDKWDMLPYVGGMQDGYDIPIAMKIRAAANGDELSTKDKQDVINFIRDYSEIQARGYSFGGNMVNGGLAGIPFLVEAGVALGTGGLAAGGTASKMAAKGGAKAVVGAAVKSVIGRTLGKEIVEQSANLSGKAIAGLATARVASTLPSVARNTGHRLINSGIAVTDKGEIYAKSAQESPAITALKAMGETEIELASEMSGGLLFRPLTSGAGAIAKSIMPRKLISALDQLALTNGGKAVSTMLRARDKVGFNGFLEEMGEEAVGDVLKTTFDLDAKEGYSFDQFLDAATFNRGSDFMVTAGLVAIQGGVSIGTVKAVNALAKSGMPQEKIDEVMAHTSELEKENIAERFNEGETSVLPDFEVVAEAPPGVEQTNEFTAAHSFPETPTLFGSVEQASSSRIQDLTEEEFSGMALTEEKSADMVSAIRAGDERSRHKGVPTSMDSSTGKLVNVTIPTSSFTDDYIEYLRDSTDKKRVDSYRDQKISTPIYAVNNGKQMIIKDGGHRLLAAIDRGDTEINALVSVDSYKMITTAQRMDSFQDLEQTPLQGSVEMDVEPQGQQVVNSFDLGDGYTAEHVKYEPFNYNGAVPTEGNEITILDARGQEVGGFAYTRQGDKIHIGDMGFNSEHQRKGLGRKIIQYIVKKEGVGHISGDLLTDNGGAPFIEKMRKEGIINESTPFSIDYATKATEEQVLSAAQRMDNALSTESANQQQKMNDVAKGGETVNISAVDKARKNQIRSEIKVIDKQMSALSKQYDETAKRMAETTDDKQADKIQKELDKIEAQMDKLSDERTAKELDSELVGKTITNSKKELVQMTRETATELQKIDKSKRVLRAIKAGFDSGVAMTKASLKIAQKEYSNLVKMLPKSQREKVAFDFKKFNSVEEAKKNLSEFEAKIENILKAVSISDRHTAIEKALKQKATVKTGNTKKAAFGAEETAVYRNIQEIYKLRELALKSTERTRTVNGEVVGLNEEEKQKRADAQNRLLEMKFNARIANKTGSFEERLVNRMLHYATTRPENMSTQEMDLLLEDINRLKEEGRAARNEAELEKRLNKSEIVDDVIAAVETHGTKPPGILKRFYVNNIANVYSVFNAYMGKAFADKYDPSLAQSKLSSAIYFSTRKLSDKIVKILKVGRLEHLPKLVSEMSELNPDWVIKKINGKVARQLSVFDVIDIYNSIKNEDIAEDYYNAYGKDQVHNLVSQLTPEQMEMADALAKHVSSYEKTLNDYNLRKRGLPLEKRANYWPASSESQGEEYDALNTYIPNSNIPSALKVKYANTVPVPRNAWQKAQKHIYQAEYIAHLADTYETIDTMLKDADASTIIKQNLGDTVYNNLKSELDFMSLQRGIQVNSEFGNALEKALGRWTAAMVASPRVFLRQFTAATTYSAEENMPLAVWTKYFVEALAHPQRTIEFMRSEIPYLEARFNEGYDEAIAKAIREAKHTSALEQDWTKAVTFFTKTGDIGSIMFGGYPYYRHMIESGMSKEEAIDKLIYTTERITQGKESSNLSTLQKDSRINYFSRFLNSPNQFVRQLVDSQIQFRRGEISKATYAKKMSQYLIMQPLIYSVIGSAYKAAAESIYGMAGGDTDDRNFQLSTYFFDIMNQILLTPFSALPLVNELVGYVLNTVEGQPTYGLFESQMITDMADSVVGITTSARHENLAGVLFHASKVLTVVGVPVKQITDLIDTVSGGELKESVSNKKKKSMYSNAW